MELKPNDRVSYYVNYRTSGVVGGWAPTHVVGIVVKVNPKTVVIRRIGWNIRTDTVPRDRVILSFRV